MTKTLKRFSLILLVMMILFQTNLAQMESIHGSIVPKTIPLFSGLPFEPFESISRAVIGLANREIHHQVPGDGEIYLQEDSALCGDNITISLIDRLYAKTNDKRKMDSLRYVMNADTENELGIEYVKEICIGYKDCSNLQKWKELISPLELIDNEIWQESNKLEFHFIKSNIKEVQSITFKVKSLEKAELYLLKNNLFGRFVDNKIQLNKTKLLGYQCILLKKIDYSTKRCHVAAVSGKRINI